MSRGGRAARTGAALLAVAALAGCVPASPDADTYDDKVVRTLGAGVSEVRTVELLLETLHTDRMLRPTAVAQLRASEDALGTATTALTELNPPPARDRLAERTSTLLDLAGDGLARARTVVERRRVGAYRRTAADLERLARRMETLEAAVR